MEKLDAIADRGYFDSEEILACEEACITVTLPKPMTPNSKAEGRFGKQNFRYGAAEDVYICPARERLAYSFTAQDNGLILLRYTTNACRHCAIKHSCTTGKERRGRPTPARRASRWHDQGRDGSTTHFLMKTLPRVATRIDSRMQVRGGGTNNSLTPSSTC